MGCLKQTSTTRQASMAATGLYSEYQNTLNFPCTRPMPYSVLQAGHLVELSVTLYCWSLHAVAGHC
jgi:hypothetical protein